MGKKAKEHRLKVEKRNRKLQQEKYMMKKQIDKLFEQRLENVNIPEITAKFGDKELPSSIVEDSGIFPNTKLNTELNNLDFSDSNNVEFIDIEVIENESEDSSVTSTIEDNNGTDGPI